MKVFFLIQLILAGGVFFFLAFLLSWIGCDWPFGAFSLFSLFPAHWAQAGFYTRPQANERHGTPSWVGPSFATADSR